MAAKKATTKSRKAKPKSFREHFEFWLDLKKQMEFDLADAIHDLKRSRQFASTIRDGLRLILTLRLGDASVLESLFPQVVKKLVEAHTNNELTDLRRELNELRERVATNAVMTPVASGLGKPLTLSLDDDDDLPAFKPNVRKLEHQDTPDELVVKKSEANNGQNMVNAFMKFFD